MTDMELTEKEVALIQIVRAAGPYADISVEKRPIKEDKEGVIFSVYVQEKKYNHFGSLRQLQEAFDD